MAVWQGLSGVPASVEEMIKIAGEIGFEDLLQRASMSRADLRKEIVDLKKIGAVQTSGGHLKYTPEKVTITWIGE